MVTMTVEIGRSISVQQRRGRSQSDIHPSSGATPCRRRRLLSKGSRQISRDEQGISRAIDRHPLGGHRIRAQLLGGSLGLAGVQPLLNGRKAPGHGIRPELDWLWELVGLDPAPKGGAIFDNPSLDKTFVTNQLQCCLCVHTPERSRMCLDVSTELKGVYFGRVFTVRV